MINLYPTENETMVVPHEWDTVIARLGKALDTPFKHRGVTNVLKGWIQDDKFQLTIKIRRQQLFMPVVNGLIDPTSKGSIIFLQYAFMPGTKVLLTFWSLILPIISLPLAYEYKNYWIIAGFLLFVIFIHVVAWANFKLHLKATREILYHILND